MNGSGTGPAGAGSGSRVAQIGRFGQSIWLDYLSRDLVRSGELARLIDRDGVSGLTSNPSIFEKAIADSALYDAEIDERLAREGADPAELYEQLAVGDIRAAADLLRPIHARTGGADGFVSLEVSPHLARDLPGTLEEARRLWRSVDRPNLMIKVPGTAEAMPAVTALTAEGINVNITLLFSRVAYRAVVEAYLQGLERRPGRLETAASVASFFVSRIDTEVDAALERPLTGRTAESLAGPGALRGRIAIANARLAYRAWKELFGGPRWDALAARGARPQRLLWASTGTKNKAYRDVLYIESLIGPATVNTVPPASLDAFRDHGEAAATLEQGLDQADADLAALESAGISLDAITAALLEDGLSRFADDFDRLLAGVARKRRLRLGSRLPGGAERLEAPLALRLDERLEAWRRAGSIRRLWAGDASLWSSRDEGRWLGWLDPAGAFTSARTGLEALRSAWVRSGARDLVLLGTGGSVLAAAVIHRILGPAGTRLHVLDTTDPARIRAVLQSIDPGRCLFVAASKSGTTLETQLLTGYFLAQAEAILPLEPAGARFAAITDPGSPLERIARERGFAAVLATDPAVGGRFSALTAYGLGPAAALGFDPLPLIDSAGDMVRSCRPCVPPAEHPGARLGLALAMLARQGRDKVTLLCSPGLGPIGEWVEQLLAESTGKQGLGLVPIQGEPAGPPAVYGSDRVFVVQRLAGEDESPSRAAIDALAAAGHPVIELELAERRQLGQLFFLWEMAVAVAAAEFGVNPFDQPAVEAGKTRTRELIEAMESGRPIAEEPPYLVEGGIRVYAADRDRAALGPPTTLAALLRAHLDRLVPGDYAALLAYVDPTADHLAPLQAIRVAVRDRRKVASCLCLGPAFQHAAGQLHKDGPASGLFVQITTGDSQDLPVPGRHISFGAVKAAQARGDLEALRECGRRVIRVHLEEAAAGLRRLQAVFVEALAEGPAGRG